MSASASAMIAARAVATRLCNCGIVSPREEGMTWMLCLGLVEGFGMMLGKCSYSSDTEAGDG